MGSAEILPFLKQVTIFTGCHESVLARLARASQMRHVPDRCVLFNKDDPATFLHILRSGLVTSVLMTPDGRELVINESCSGETIGEVAAATSQPYWANAITRGPAELVLIPTPDFAAALAEEPRIMVNMLGNLAGWLRTSTERESALAFLDAPARLALLLLKLDREASSIGYLTISQEELAQYVGVTRQTAARVLGQWRRAGWIFTGRGRVALLNRNALRRLTEESA
ncbi:MAG: Crp/Fnr family transcriptional regulator [Rudaea sp.]